MRATFIALSLAVTASGWSQSEPRLIWESPFFEVFAPESLDPNVDRWRADLELSRQRAIQHWTRPLNRPVRVNLWPRAEWEALTERSRDLFHALAFVTDRGRLMQVNHAAMLGSSPPRRQAALVHEYAHVYFNQMLDSWPEEVQVRRLPRWLEEGLAIAVAGERHWFDPTRLNLLGPDQMIPLVRIADTFPPEPERQALAYRESADVVAHMIDHRTDLKELIDQIVSPTTGPAYVERAWSREMVESLEAEWHETLRVGWRWLLILTSGGFVWAVAMVLALFAWLRKRRLARQRVYRWAMEAEGLILTEPGDDEETDHRLRDDP